MQLAFEKIGAAFNGLPPRMQSWTKTVVGVELSLGLRSGTSLRELEAAAPYLAAHFRARLVRVVPNPMDAGRALLQLVFGDPFSGPPLPAAPLARPISAWDPVPLGVDENGAPAAVELAVELFEHNLLLGGEPGSGKSSSLRVLVARLVIDPAVSIYLLDPKMVEFSPYAPLVMSLAHSMAEALCASRALWRRSSAALARCVLSARESGPGTLARCSSW